METLLTKEEPDMQEGQNAHIVDLQLGVWTVRMAKTPPHQKPHKFWTDFREGLPLIWRLICDVFRITPYYLTIYLLCQFTSGWEGVVLLRSSDQLLKTVESGLISGKPDVFAIFVDMIYRLGYTVLFAITSKYSNDVYKTLHNQILDHYKVVVMKANLRLDLTASQEAANKSLPNANDAWDALQTTIEILRTVIETGSQLAFIIHLSRHSSGGPFFVFLCLLYPLSTRYMSHSMWNDSTLYGYISNQFYSRMRALETFVNGNLRQDIVSGGLADWIASEYEQANTNLGADSTLHPRRQSNTNGLFLVRKMFFTLIEISPMMYCSVHAALNPSKFSISSIATLQQSVTQLRSYLQSLLSYGQRITLTLATVKTFYKLQESGTGSISSKGAIPYPDPQCDPETITKGMSFNLSNVCFSYPGAQSTTPALKDIYLDIKAGQLIVIVGANGGGKSTLIRILTRLYEPTSGTVHIDGRPATEYNVSDLHQATALLSQENKLYPLSLSENIGLGHPDKASDDVFINEAADDGDASGFLSNLKDGKETILQPILNIFQMKLRKNKSHVLYKEMEQLRKKIDLSGGERQKVVSARMFMRFKSGKVKFVAVDEPSSALDAEAELRLFQNLIKYREGKTLVFVTHRFGHLTKHADQIICLKDGSICESGSHEQLMARRGEYAKLYDIQASAFKAGNDS